MDRLRAVIRFCEPRRSYITIVTNGYAVGRERLEEVRALGVDKIGVSLESMDPAEHDANRNRPGCFANAFQTLELAREVGFDTAVNTTISRMNFDSPGVRRMLEYCRAHSGVTLDVNPAMPVGNWEGRKDLLLTDLQRQMLFEEFSRFGTVRQDVFPRFGCDGCPAIKESVSVNQAGDVYPCVFIHTRLGNLREHSLKDILDNARGFELFREPIQGCLLSGKHEFYERYLTRTFGKPKPYDGIELYNLGPLPKRSSGRGGGQGGCCGSGGKDA